jgi:hypothetical protein
VRTEESENEMISTDIDDLTKQNNPFESNSSNTSPDGVSEFSVPRSRIDIQNEKIKYLEQRI